MGSQRVGHDWVTFTFKHNFSSVQFCRSVMSDSLRPHESQHARPTCPSPTPGVYSNSCPSSRWCHPAISSSVVPFSSCPQSLPASGSFPMSQLFTWRGQSIGVSVSASVLPMNTQDWSPLGWTGWISLQSKGLSKESPPTPQFKSINSLALSYLYNNLHIYSAPNSLFVQFCPNFWQTTANNISQVFLYKIGDCHCSNTVFCCYLFMFVCEFVHKQQCGAGVQCPVGARLQPPEPW